MVICWWYCTCVFIKLVFTSEFWSRISKGTCLISAMLGATGFLAETANNFPSTLTKVCPHCSRSHGSKAEMRHYTGMPHLCPHYRQGQTALAVPNGARATSALFQGSHSHFASSYVLLENERGRNLQHVKGNLEGGCQVCQALSQCKEHSSKAPLHRTLDWEDLRKKSQTNFKSHIRDFRFCNKSIGVISSSISFSSSFFTQNTTL